MSEIWKDIQNYKGLYQISNLGNLRNKHNKIMHTKPSKDGYVRVLLCKNGKYKSHYIFSRVHGNIKYLLLPTKSGRHSFVLGDLYGGVNIRRLFSAKARILSNG